MNRIGDWIQTNSGVAFWPLDPRPEEIRIEDIAHALAHQCRFSGHTREFYSVAEHSVRVSLMCDPRDALWGLLHDASEAYLQDVARPIKQLPAMAEYRNAEERLQKVIGLKFGLHRQQPDSVSIADKIMLGIEARDLMAPQQPGWEKWLALIGDRTEQITTTHYPPAAKAMFLAQFEILTGVRG